MATVRIPNLALHLTGGRSRLEVDGATVGELLQALEQHYPGIAAILGDRESLAPGVAVAVDGEIRGQQIYHPVNPGSEVLFIPAIFGG